MKIYFRCASECSCLKGRASKQLTQAHGGRQMAPSGPSHSTPHNAPIDLPSSATEAAADRQKRSRESGSQSLSPAPQPAGEGAGESPSPSLSFCCPQADAHRPAEPLTKRRKLATALVEHFSSSSSSASRASTPAPATPVGAPDAPPLGALQGEGEGEGHGKRPARSQKGLPPVPEGHTAVADVVSALQMEQPAQPGTPKASEVDQGVDIAAAVKGASVETGVEANVSSTLDASIACLLTSFLQPTARRERPAVIEERSGLIEFRAVENDGLPESMILLTGLKNIFQRQLPKMPREYITRLVLDRNHRSMAIVKRGLHVVGGITYRPFEQKRFAEIVFCAITSTEQVKVRVAKRV